jgi:HPt (histidine-containing phosphotransfer) domain-containing protein
MPVIDLPTFEKLKNDAGADFVGELIVAYCKETPQLMARLQRALMARDADTFRQVAHSIKSTSNTFGALQLGALAKELETMGREGNLTNAHHTVDQLVAEYDRVLETLKELNRG